MIKPGENTGFIEMPPGECDYIAGIQMAEVVRNPSGDWRTYEPQGENQKLMGAATPTSSTGFETDACVSFSACDTIEVFVDWLISQRMVPQETVDWLRANGYFDGDGKLNTSDRFVAKVSGTTLNGNGFQPVGDAIKHYGLVPETLWPFPINEIDQDYTNAWNIYYKDVPQNVLDMGQEFLKRFRINYEWVFARPGTATPTTVLNSLRIAPLQIATAVCDPWNTAEPIQGCGAGASHATCLTAVDTDYHILDHYVPYDKLLDLNYDISYGFRYIVSPVPVQSLVDGSQKVVDAVPNILKEIDSLSPTQQPYWKAVIWNILEAIKKLWGGDSSVAGDSPSATLFFMTMSPAVAGFIKGVGLVVVVAVVSYLADAAHLTGVLNPTLATIAAGVFSAIESSLKASSGGTTALFGAVRLS